MQFGEILSAGANAGQSLCEENGEKVHIFTKQLLLKIIKNFNCWQTAVA